MSRQRPEHYSVSVKDIHYEPDGYATYPTPIEDMKVPRNANIRIDPKLRKKFSWVDWLDIIARRGIAMYLLKFITRVQDDRRQQQIEE